MLFWNLGCIFIFILDQCTGETTDCTDANGCDIECTPIGKYTLLYLLLLSDYAFIMYVTILI